MTNIATNTGKIKDIKSETILRLVVSKLCIEYLHTFTFHNRFFFLRKFNFFIFEPNFKRVGSTYVLLNYRNTLKWLPN